MEFIELGQIQRPHGYAGSFIVSCPSGQDSALGYVPQVWVGSPSSAGESLRVIEASWMPKGWKLTVENITSDTQVSALRGQTVFSRREWLAPTSTNSFYVADLIGASVRSVVDGSAIGTLEQVETGCGGCDRWWVATVEDSFAIPALRRYIERVDAAKREIWVQDIAELQ